MEFKTLTIEQIAEWCAANNQLDWLEAELSKKVKVKVYPKVDGVNKNGKRCKLADKSQKPIEEERDMPFVTLKTNFAKKFIPTLITAEPKKPTMLEYVKSLRNK